MSTDYKNNIKTEKLLEYIKKTGENRRFVQTLELSLTLLLIAGFGFFAIRPTFLTISNLMGEIKAKEIAVKEMQKKINSLEIAQKTYSDIQKDYLAIERSLPQSPGYNDASITLRSAAKQHSIEFEKIGFNLKYDDKNSTSPNKSLVATKNYSTIVNIKSDFVSLINLIDKLSRTQRPIIISSVNMAIQQQREASASGISLGVNPVFYYLPKNK
jgi:Tfp pilus assembly protein PilO